MTKLTTIEFAEPQGAVGACGNTEWATGCRGRHKLGNRPTRRDPSNLITLVFGKPEIAIRSSDNPLWNRVGRWERELGYRSRRG
jgi:hypothetical protein